MTPDRERTGAPSSRTGLRVGIARWAAASHPAGMIHGAVVTAATLALMGDHAGTDVSLLGAVGVLVVYWLTHGYTHALGRGIDGAHPHLARRLLDSTRLELPILLGGVPALATVGILATSGVALTTAMTAGLWVTVVLMGAYGYLAAHLAGVSGWRTVVETGFAAVLGLVMVGLNMLLH